MYLWALPPEKEFVRMKQETEKRENMILDGIRIRVNSKVIFMKEALKYKPVVEQLTEMLQEDKEFRKKLRGFSEPIRPGSMIRLDLIEEDLVLIYDAMIRKKGKKLQQIQDELIRFYVKVIEEGNLDVSLDITTFLAFAITDNEACRRELEQIPDKSEYYSLWEQSEYRRYCLESRVAAENIWTLRQVIGMIEKARAAGGDVAYEELLRVIHLGFRKLKHQIKKMGRLSGAVLKKLLQEEVQKRFYTYPVMCKTVVCLLLAEELGLRIEWDFDMLVIMKLLKNAEAELAGGKEELSEEAESIADQENETDAEELQEETQMCEFLKRFDEKYTTHGSLTEMIWANAKEEGDIGVMMQQIMSGFGMDPRKLKETVLTEEECRQLYQVKDHWSMKSFFYVQVVAQLCKRLAELERIFLERIPAAVRVTDWKREQELLLLKKQISQCEVRNKALEEEKRRLTEEIQQKERYAAKWQKQKADADTVSERMTQELQALRHYVHCLKEDTDVREEPLAEATEKWKNRKVLVVGGHIGWQNKLKEYFPDWQFTASERRIREDDVIKGKEYIICNTEILSHADYYKLVAARDKGQKLLYVHSNNLQRCMTELEGQL